MEHQEGYFNGIKSIKIFYQMWIPEKPIAIFQAIHGFGEHSYYYQTIIDTLVPQGFLCVMDDHRGHGKSEGKTMYVDSFDQFVEDEKILFDLTKKQYPDLPVFLFGQSMGSIIALKFAQKYESQIKGLILAASGTKIGGNVSKILIFMSKLLAVLLPHIMVPSGGLNEFMSHDTEIVKQIMNDPLVHQEKTSARLGYGLISGFANTPNIASQLKLPLLFVRGGDDKLVVDAEPLINAFQMVDKTIKIYPNLYHAIYLELEKDRKEPLADLKNWLVKHV